MKMKRFFDGKKLESLKDKEFNIIIPKKVNDDIRYINSSILSTERIEPKFKKITEFNNLELEMLSTALSVYDADMSKPDHHTREKLNVLRDKIEILKGEIGNEKTI